MLATVKSTTSRYKSCQANGGTYFPFSDGAVIASFDERIKTDYSRCLAAMNSYVADYIDVCGDTKKDEYLVKALVEVIASDSTIDTNQPFYVCEDGSALTKAQICAASELCLQSFLLGIWHYITRALMWATWSFTAWTVSPVPLVYLIPEVKRPLC